MDKIWEWVRHYKWMLLGLVYVAVLLGANGCKSMVAGPKSGAPVTRHEYAIEMNELNADLEQRKEDFLADLAVFERKGKKLDAEGKALIQRGIIDTEEFERQDAIRKQILSIATGYLVPFAESKGVTPETTTALMGVLAATVFGLANGVRKDRVITAKEAEITALKNGNA